MRFHVSFGDGRLSMQQLRLHLVAYGHGPEAGEVPQHDFGLEQQAHLLT